MTPTRVARVALALLLLISIPSFAAAATTEFRVLFDLDDDDTTGCTVNGMDGVDQVLVTQVTDGESSIRVTRTHREVCTGSVLGGPVDIVTDGWNAGWNGTSRLLNFETRIPFTAFGSEGMPDTIHVGFDASRSASIHTSLMNQDGSPIHIPAPPSRRRAVGADRHITMDESIADWGRIKPAVIGLAGNGTQALRLLRILAWPDNGDGHLYFAVMAYIGGDYPWADDNIYYRNPGESVAIAPPGVLDNDGIPGGAPLTAEKVSDPARGTVTLNADGSFTYSPTHPQLLTDDEFEYMAIADGKESNAARVVIRVNQGESPNAPQDDAYTTPEDTQKVVPAPGVLENDPHTDLLVASLFSPPSHGAVVINADGGFTYTPDDDFFGVDSFVYTAAKKQGAPEGIGGNATVTITVTPVNDPPTIDPATFSIAENSPNDTIVGTVSANDVDNDALSFYIVSGNTGGAFSINLLTGQIRVANSAALDFETTPTFLLTVRVEDADDSAQAVITINLTDTNEPPVIVAGGTLNYTENDPPTVIDGALTVTDTDSANLTGATVVISANFAGGQDVLSFTPVGAITGNFVGDTLTLTGTDTVANYELALRSVTYQNTSDDPSIAARTITWTASDGSFSSAPVTSTVNVIPVNDAPVLTAGGTLNYTENDPPSAIDTTIAITDVDSATMSGATAQITGNYVNGEDVLSYVTALGITGSFNAATGTLTLSGVAPMADYQTAMRNVLYNNTSDNPSTLARTVTWQVNDGGGVNNLSNTATSTINVATVNDAPVLASGAGSPSFTEDGAAVVVDGGITVTDADDVNLESAAVTITNLLDGASEVLAANTGGTAIVANYVGGVLTLTGTDTLANYQMVLRSVTYENTSDNPTTTARSISFVVNDGDVNSNTVSKSVAIVAVNDAPVLTAGGTLNYTENDPATAIDTTITISDVDSTTMSGATAQITGNYVNGEDVLSYVTALGITGSFNAATGTLTLSGVAPIADYQTAMRNVLYNNTSDNPSTLARTVTWQVDDGGAVDNLSNTAASTINVAAVNDAPVLASGAGSPSFTEDGAAVVVDGGITVTDADDTNLESATVTITNLLDGASEVLAANTGGTAIVANYVGGVLTLTGTDTLANYQMVLRSVTYENTSDNPTTTARSISFVVNDGDVNSNTVSKSVAIVAVNDAPVLTAGGTLNYAENDPATAIDTTITISDVDSATISSATAQITGNYVNGEDVLSYVTALGITGSFNAAAGTLTLSGVAPLADYQTAMRNVLYNNTSDNPSTAARTVTWQVNDGAGVNNLSNTPTSTINVAAVNDAPVVNAVSAFGYTEGTGAQVIDAALTTSDVDDTQFSGATIQITANYTSGEDILAFVDAFGITGSWNAGTGTLTLSGTTTIANYQSALRTVTYQNTSANPSIAPRTVTWTVTDMAAAPGSDTTTINITPVNSAPVLTAGGTLNYTENDPASVIDNTVTVTDADTPTLASATVQITSNYVNGEDVLSYVTALGITGSFNAGTGTLTLTGPATPADWQTALRNVLYNNTSDDPSTLARTVTWQIDDGEAVDNLSNTPTSTINVAAVNDPPVVGAVANINYTEDDGAVVIDNSLTVADPDNTNLTGGTVQITANYVNGQDVLAFANAFGITGVWNAATGTLTLSGTTTVANYQSALRTITYENLSQSPSTAVRTVTWTVNDGTDPGSDTTTITISSVNDAPVLTITGAISYTENDPATNAATAANITDPDDTNIDSATIQITGNYVNGEDVLSYTTALGITGVFTPASGTLTLTGSTTLANYITALQNVQYTNTSDAPSTLQRTLTWTVNDGDTNSNSQTSTISVVAVNDAPVNSVPGAQATNEDSALTFNAGNGNLISVSDVDAGGASVQVTLAVAGGTVTASAGASITNNGTANVTLNGTLANLNASLDGLVFNPTPNSFGAASVTVTTNDGGATGTGGAQQDVDVINITVNPINDAPVLSVTAAPTPTYTENAAAMTIATGASITDVDDVNIETATVQITGNYEMGGDVLSYTPALGITGVFTPASGTLTLTGPATLANFATALQNVMFASTSENPSALQRTVTWTVNDGDTNSNSPTTNIDVVNVNDPPAINANDLAYIEDAGAVAIDATLTVTDPDDATLPSATVQITANYVNGEDILAFTNAFGITGNFVPATGTLTLTGPASPADFQSALRTVTYQNTSNTPSTAPRTVTWTVNDDEPSSGTDTTTITVTATNDAPVLTLSGVLNYTENDPASNAATSATITDADDTNIESATIQITTNYQNGQDVLSYTTALGISGVFTAASGTLQLTGSASLADYQTALLNVQYANTSENPSTLARTLTWTVNDGDTNSNNQTSTINVTSVNDAPVVTPTGTPLAYTENDPATAVQPLITVTDVDSANITGATVQLTTNYQNGQDVLSYVTALGITGVFNAGTGTLTLSGTTTVADYQTALRNVLYNNTSENPSQLARTVAWQVNDGAGVNNLSTIQNSTINVTAVNDAPTAVNDAFDTIGNTELRVDMVAGTTPNASETVNDAGSFQGLIFNDSDVEGDPFAITAVGSGCGDPTAPFDCTLASGAVVHVEANGEFSFTPGPGDTADSFTYTVTDVPTVGTAASANGTVTLTFFEMVWYVEQGAAGNGTSISPFGNFDSLDGAGGAGDSDAAGDYIFVHNTGTPLAASASVPLESNQHVLGEGVGLSIAVNLNGNGSPTNLVAAGTQPVVTLAAGDLFTIANAIPIEIRGLSLTSTAANVVSLDSVAGALTGSPTLTIANNTIGGAGAEGLDINLNGTTTGTLALAITNNTWNTAGTHTGNAIDIVRGGGTLNVNVSNNTNILSTGAAGISINGGAVANTNVTGFADNSVHGNTVGIGATITNVTFDSVAGGAINQVDGNNFAVGASGNPVGASGFLVTASQGNLFFDDLDVLSAVGTALQLSGTGTGLTFSVTASTSGGTSTLDADNGAAVDASSVALDLRLADLDSNTGLNGVTLNTVSGQFSAPSGSQITKTSGAGTGFLVNGSSATVTYGGTLNVSSGAGVALTTNTGVMGFTGQMTLSTGTSAAFTATGGGTVTATATNSTVATTTGTPVTISGTTIGGTGVTFQSVASTGSAANGIVLNGTGSGAFLVRGDNTLARNGSGGTITNTSGDAIQLTNANNVTLQSMNLTSNGSNPATAADAAGTGGNHTVQINGGSNVILSGVYIDGSDGSGFVALNLTGTNRLNNNTRFENTLAGAGHSIYVNNTNTNMTLFELNNMQMIDNAATHTNFFFANTGTSNMTLTVQNNCLFEDLGTQALTVAAGGTAATSGTLTSTILNSDFQNAKGLGENNVGILVNNSATHVSTVQGNLFENIAQDGTIANTSIIRTQNSGGKMTVTVDGNTIQNISYAAGNGGRHVIGHVFEPVGYTASDFSNVIIQNNIVSNVTYPGLAGNNREAIFVDYRTTASNGELSILNNNISMSTSGAQQAMELRFRQTNNSTVPVLLQGNTVTFNTANVFLDVDAEDGANVQLTVNSGNNFTNSNGTPGSTIAVASEDPAAAGGPPTMCVNVTGNTLQGGAGTIQLDETAGTMNVTQASAAAMAGANGIPAGNVTTSGTPTFGQPACTLP